MFPARLLKAVVDKFYFSPMRCRVDLLEVSPDGFERKLPWLPGKIQPECFGTGYGEGCEPVPKQLAPVLEACFPPPMPTNAGCRPLVLAYFTGVGRTYQTDGVLAWLDPKAACMRRI